MDHQEADGNRHGLQAMAESSVALVGGRLVTPLLLAVCIGLITWIGSNFSGQLAKQGEDLAQVKSDVRDLNTRLDAQVIRQVETNTKRLDTLDERVQRIEREGLR